MKYTTSQSTILTAFDLDAAADPGFSPGGAPTPKSSIIFQFFCRKLHENERIWTPRGGVPGAPHGFAKGMKWKKNPTLTLT